MSLLTGQVALVTGAALNIGQAIVQGLAREGATVVIHANRSIEAARDLAGEIEALGGKAMALAGDLTVETEVEALFAAVDEHFGRLDLLVNNASVRGQQPASEMTLDAWRAVQAVIVDGTFLCCREAYPLLRRSRGRIVNLGGVAGHRGAVGRAHAVTAKAAVAGLTKALAREWAADFIRVNCVVPGMVETVRGASAGGLPGDLRIEDIPLGRKATPEEVAACVLALAGPAGAYVTGQAWHVNGGLLMP
ncbi:MAG: SDR family NAD(P)-dependent oxidoreductase [Pseudomonadota bacterium]